ncbi:MAG TPA: hypothetical protein VFW00_01725, partial [Rhodocyclaceae bacterium]|nr:hypothetical protein [Rhodocyclaceae bacterium]
YLDHQLAAALVYRYGAHQISVFIVPETKPLTRSATSIRGYQVVHQQVAAMDFWLVSDAEPAVITKLSQLLVGQ